MRSVVDIVDVVPPRYPGALRAVNPFRPRRQKAATRKRIPVRVAYGREWPIRPIPSLLTHSVLRSLAMLASFSLLSPRGTHEQNSPCLRSVCAGRDGVSLPERWKRDGRGQDRQPGEGKLQRGNGGFWGGKHRDVRYHGNCAGNRDGGIGILNPNPARED